MAFLQPGKFMTNLRTAGTLLALGFAFGNVPLFAQSSDTFSVEEATIAQIQRAILDKRVTTQGIVEAYLKRIQAYNGTCVNQPQGVLGRVTTIPHARQINALSTLNLRPAAREKWNFDARKARSMTDAADDAASMPDALETAAAQDRELARTGQLVGPLQGVVMPPSCSGCAMQAPSSWRKPTWPNTPLMVLAAPSAAPSAIPMTLSASLACRQRGRRLLSPPIW